MQLISCGKALLRLPEIIWCLLWLGELLYQKDKQEGWVAPLLIKRPGLPIAVQVAWEIRLYRHISFLFPLRELVFFLALNVDSLPKKKKTYQIDLKIHAVNQETGNNHMIFKTKEKQIGGSNSPFKNYTGNKNPRKSSTCGSDSDRRVDQWGEMNGPVIQSHACHPWVNTILNGIYSIINKEP